MTAPQISDVVSTQYSQKDQQLTPPGFRRTEVGVIPEDWHVVRLGSVSSFINGRAYALHEWEKSGTPVIRLQNLTGRGDEFYYSNLSLPERQYCDYGDLLFMWSASFGPYIWSGNKAIYHYHIWKIQANSGYEKMYLYYLFGDMTERLKSGSSSGGTMLHVTKGKMESTLAAFPSIAEQTAIANALSDVDALIQELEKLIAKKQAIKTATMQQLLTGRTRLPQFAHHPDGRKKGYKPSELGEIPEDWEVKFLSDVAVFGGGTTPARNFYEKYYAFGSHSWVKTLDLNNGFIEFTEECVTDAALAETSLKKHPAGSVLIAMYGGFNQIGRTGLLKMDSAINQALVAVIPKKGLIVSEYLLYSFNYKVDYWKGVASSSRKDPNITSSDVKNFIIPLPQEKEQTAIATILSDMGKEIKVIEQRLNKTREIKEGMMQELLTGKTRLVKPAGAA